MPKEKLWSLEYRIIAIAAAITALATPLPSMAQSFPNKAIHFIVGYGPGGPTDVAHRVVGADIAKRLGQPVVVENRPGANAVIAAQAVMNSPPDGYMLFAGSVTVFAPVLVKENSIVASKEMVPVATTSLGHYFVFVPSSLGVNSLKDLAVYGKANPGKLRLGAPGPSNHMVMAMIAKRLGITYEYIPYKTTDQIISALLNGDAQLSVQALVGYTPHLDSGKLKALATLGAERDTTLSGVPTAREQGLPLTLHFNQGLWGPLGMPRDAVLKVNNAMNEALRDPQTADKIRAMSLVVAPMTPDEMLKAYESEIAFYTEAAALIGFKPQ